MQNKIESIDWKKAATDVEPFLNTGDKQALNLWSNVFFIDKLNKLENIIKNESQSGTN